MVKDNTINKDNNITNEGGDTMTLLARPGNMITISKNKSKQFLEDSKKNTIQPSHLKRCQRYAQMMKGKDK